MFHTSSVRIEGSGQVVDFIEHALLIVKRERHTLRITIHNDDVKTQAFGSVERWDGKKWTEVVRSRELVMALGVGYSNKWKELTADQKAKPFAQDRNRLVTLAEEVL